MKYEQWTQIPLLNAKIWRENFSGNTRAEYYPEKDGAFGTALAYLQSSFGPGPRIWLVQWRISDGTYLQHVYDSREEAEKKILSELSQAPKSVIVARVKG